VEYKTSYYSFYLPVALAMYMMKVPQTYTIAGQTVSPYSVALSILLPLGEYFQIQDDFLDYSGTPEQIGKIGTDILDNKCSWCINTALSVATPEQRKTLDENYGRKDSNCEAKVKQIFEEVGLRERYAKYEETVYQQIMGMIESIPETEGPGTLKKDVFKSFVGKIYKRTK
jgi:farnesyl diphosphate synthase